MKRIIIILIALTMVGVQKIEAQTGNYDFKEMALMAPGNKTAGLILGDPIDKAVTILGQPTSISDQYLEMDETTAKVYQYGKNKLYFVNNSLINWDLFDSSIIVGKVNGDIFKIGDKIVTEVKKIQFGPQTRTQTTRSFHSFVVLPPVNRSGYKGKKKPKPEVGPVYGSYLKNDGLNTELSMFLQFNKQDELINISLIRQ